MAFIELIEKKRDGLSLTPEEIAWFIHSLVAGDLPDYQVSALLMAICLRGLTPTETFALTSEMAASGEQLTHTDFPGPLIDKHSTGGVGDAVTLAFAPLVACCGATVFKMSGRGLGFTGGTVDKLESIPGVNLALTSAQMRAIARETGFVVASQSENMAPADKILYALRDVTGTVPSIPLIASSIMSKKLAQGAGTILLDVTVGSGAFMKTRRQAKELSLLMVEIGRRAGRNMRVCLTGMERPLSLAVGNRLEIYEAAQTLQGKPGRLQKMVLALGSHALQAAGVCDKPEALRRLKAAIASGEGYRRFCAFIKLAGGDPSFLSAYTPGANARYGKTLYAKETGWLRFVNTADVGRAALVLGAGRTKKGEAINPEAGLLFHGEGCFTLGNPMVTLFSDDKKALAQAETLLQQTIRYGDKPTGRLILEAF